MGEIFLKTGDFSARDILVAPQCKNLVVALQEYFKIKFGAFLIINSILNEVLMLNFDHGAICEPINPIMSYRTLQNHKKNKPHENLKKKSKFHLKPNFF